MPKTIETSGAANIELCPPHLHPAGLPHEQWRGSAVMHVFAEGGLGAEFVCVAPSPEPEEGPSLRAWRWLPWAEDLPVTRRWRERLGQEKAAVFLAWAMALKDRAEKAEARLSSAATTKEG